MASVFIASFAFMLVVATATAYPVIQEEKVLNDKNLIKAFMNLWNEKTGKNQHAEAMNLWNGEAEEDQIKINVRNEEGDKESVSGKDDRDGNIKEDKDGEIQSPCNQGKPCYSSNDCCGGISQCTIPIIGSGFCT